MSAHADGVAIVGMAGRFPGAGSVAEFWRNLDAATESITRLDGAQTADGRDAQRVRPRHVPARGIIADAARFDAAFFGIRPAEAQLIDPQQRVFLELCWNALEHAALDPRRFAGSIGVYAGVSDNGYRRLVESRPDLVEAAGDFATMLANDKDYVATRVAHRIGLTGPALGIQTACSTSLVAVAQAWYALMSWQCDAALAGGINIVVPRDGDSVPVDGAMESPDGHCRPFDAAAGGTVFSSGGGVVVLKRLADALADRDTIWAVIRGVGVNNDGADKASFSAPSARGQAAAIRLALASAGVGADAIGYVEAHGTGTALGDPIEIEGLSRAFAEDTSAHGYCWLGSVKGNIGHLVGGAGIAGLIKAVLSLHHERIPATLHYRSPNPQIDLAPTPFRIADRGIAWPRGETPRVAGVSAFGVGGTNAHVIVEEAPARAAAAAAPRAHLLLPLSANDAEGLQRRARDLTDALDDLRDEDLADAGWTLAVGRRALPMRAAISAGNVAEARERLRELHPLCAAIDMPRVVFVFPGQGAQHPGMARYLCAHEPAFAVAFAHCCELAAALGCDLRAAIDTAADSAAAAAALRETRLAQPALFAFEYSLAQLWQSWGITPAAMVGHSIGEYVAACLAGVFSLADAMRLVIARGNAMQAQQPGAMLAVRCSRAELEPRLPAGITIAAANAADSIVVAGGAAAIDAFARELEAARIASARLPVSHAFHSAAMDGALPLLRRAFEPVRLHAPAASFYSCISGLPITAAEATSADYWCRQLRAPVQFADAIDAALAPAGTIALEVGPGQTLTTLLRRRTGLRDRAFASLAPAGAVERDGAQLATTLGALWCRGIEVDWDRYFVGAERRRLALPGYPFHGPRYWIDALPAPAAKAPAAEETPAAPAPAAVAVPGDALRGAVRELIATVTGTTLTAAQDRASFIDLGLDSLALTQAALALENRFGLRLKLRELVDDIGTIERLVARIASLPGADCRGFAQRSDAAPVVSAVVPGPVASAGSDVPFGAQARIERRAAHGLEPRQQAWLAAFTQRYVARTGKSKELSQRHRAGMADPRVVTGFNPLWKELVYPIVVERSAGAQLWDIDGNRYIDLLNAFGANLLGYQPACVTAALTQQIEAGFEIGPQHPLAGDVASLIRTMTGVERVAFCNTGSEAVMGAMRIARTVTGRKTIVIFRNSYHGIFDEVIVRGTSQLRSVAAAPGILANAVENILVLDYGSPAALETIRERGASLAAVMIEPVQSRAPDLQPREFVQALRALCDAAGCALIFDEVITGFRLGQGGAQEFYDVRADIATYGKVIGGGLPLAAIGGRSAWLDALDGGAWQFGDDSRPEAGVTYFAGTFVRHPLALAAAKATLEHLQQRGPSLQRSLNERCTALLARLNAFFVAQGAPMRAVGCSSLWSVRIDADQVLADLFFYALRERGLHVYAQFNCFLSDAHGDAEVEQVCAAIEAAALELLDAGILQRKGRAALADAFGAVAPAPGAANDAPLNEASAGGTELPPPVRLTDAQTEKWLACQFGDAASVAFNESQLVLLSGELDRAALERTVMQVCARHEAFAMSFAADGSVLRVGPIKAISPGYVDLDGADEAALSAHCAAAVRRPFDLTRAPLVRIELMRLGPRRHALLIVAHHLVFDGWSAAVFLQELATVYRETMAGRAVSLPPAQSFREFAQAERARATSPEVRAQVEHWLQIYAAPPDVLDLPGDAPPPHEPNFSAATCRADLAPALTAATRQFARHGGVTVYSVLLAGFAVLLARLSGHREFAVGIPFASQARTGRAALIGDGVNTLPLRLRVEPDWSFEQLTSACHDALLDAADNQDLTTYTLLGALAREQRDAQGALSDVIFNLNPRVPALDFGALDYAVRDCAKAALVKQLFFNLNENAESFTLDVHYRTALFTEATVLRWAGYYLRLLERATADPRLPVGRLPLLDAAERRAILDLGTSALRIDTPTTSLPALIFAQAARSPQRTALESGDRSVTYAELAASAAATAQGLIERGAGPGTIIGVCVPRGVDLVVALLGIMASGAAYVPLDPSYPEDRLRRVSAAAGIHLVVAGKEFSAQHGLAGCEVCDIERLNQPLASQRALPPVPADATAYVLFTSGSTGAPKGVRVLQRNLVNCLLSMREQPGLDADDVLCAVTPLSFDIAALELYLPLLVGARVVVATEQQRRDPDALVALLRDRAATILQTTPAWLRALASDDRLRHLEPLKLLVGGEELARDLAERVLPRCRELWNLYGPTETTIWSSASRVVSGTGSVPIGAPIANTRIYLLDGEGGLVPAGVRGEIWIAGAGVAAGYLNEAALTADRFRVDPFVAGERMYRSGDIGSWRGGALHFHGRSDDQIKLRGFRIEPGDIEAAACAQAGVAAAVAALHEVSASDRRLVLYVVAPGANRDFARDLRERLRRRLPPHMVPQHIELLDALPQTAHGKIDRRALPAPSAIAAPAGAAPDTGDDALSGLLLGIWREVLGVADVGPDSNFFDLGGDSLLGVELFQRAHARIGVNLPLATLLTAQTVREQAGVFRAAGVREPGGALPAADRWSPLVPIQTGGSRPPLFCVHALGGNVLNYVPLARALGAEQPFYGLQAVGLDGVSAPLVTIEEMAARYLQEIRQHSPQGPYFLCGGSMGGLIALELAQRLRADGHDVAFLGLFDTYGPLDDVVDTPHDTLTHWRERFNQLRGLDPPARRGAVAAALGRRVFRGCDALRKAWYRWRGRPLPHGVRYRELERIHLHADASYRPRPYVGEITLFRAHEQPERLRASWALGWESVALGGVRVVDLPGTHDTLIEQPELARALHCALEGARGGVHAERDDSTQRRVG